MPYLTEPIKLLEPYSFSLTTTVDSGLGIPLFFIHGVSFQQDRPVENSK